MKWRFCKITDITKTEYEAIYNGLTPSRRAHIDRMKQQDDRLRSLAVTHLLNSILEEFGVCDSRLEVLENGKPHLVGSDLFFSLSHSEEGVAAVVSGTPVGIDIEKIEAKEISIIIGIAKRWFCENEQNYIFDREFSSESFLYVWTRKEALSKLSGLPFATVSVRDTFTCEEHIDTVMDDGYIISIATNI